MIIEVFKEGNNVAYETSSTICSCTYFKEHQAPCHHILYIRMNDETTPIFDMDLFNSRYFKIEEVDMQPMDYSINHFSV